MYLFFPRLGTVWITKKYFYCYKFLLLLLSMKLQREFRHIYGKHRGTRLVCCQSSISAICGFFFHFFFFSPDAPHPDQYLTCIDRTQKDQWGCLVLRESRSALQGQMRIQMPAQTINTTTDSHPARVVSIHQPARAAAALMNMCIIVSAASQTGDPPTHTHIQEALLEELRGEVGA